jgi:hypothetical protein
VTREELWNGNRESLRNAFLSRNSIFLFALRSYRPRRRSYPERLAAFPHVRLRSKREVERFLSSATRAT